MKKFTPVDPKKDFIKMEQELLNWWYASTGSAQVASTRSTGSGQAGSARIAPTDSVSSAQAVSGIVEKYLHKNDDSEKRFSFLDGPITANNPMGVHHAWGRTYKDLWQRYKNMQGFKQRFQNGFDNQGLWVEVEVEKNKGFKSKKDIEEYGIEKFVQDCKDWTIKWSLVQRDQSIRLGYFMNWGDYDGSDYSVIDENKYSYYTMSSENNYMIWSFLKKCNDEGWLYKGMDALPWCPRCGTAISQHEILTEEYKEVTHTSVFFQLPIKGKKDEYLLVWTTTPWTLAGNVAVAVNPEFTYVKVRQDNKIYYLSKAALKVLTGECEILEEIKGEEMVGWNYVGPYDKLPAQKGAQHVVVEWELVGEDEGTGLVHIAPGAGKEDFDLSKELKLKVIVPIDGDGVYVEGFDWLTGKNVNEAVPMIFDDLEKSGFLYKLQKYTHRYPKCWRCKTELLFRVVDEWFIAMDKPGKDGRSLRERMINMVSVKEKDGGTKWIPEFGQDRELDWLKNMHDWMISKKRYWGLALPIWVCNGCGNFEVIGSKEELKKKAVEGWDKFEGHTPHRPFIDEVKIKCSKCGGVAERVKDVGNPWLDAGIVPYSTLNYRTDKEYWEKWFPVDFVTECFPGQFKNWFYALIAMSAVLEDKMPFKTLLGHALVKDEHGEEMHKSAGNAIPFDEGAEKMGADLMRWQYCRSNPRTDIWFGYGPADEVKRQFYLLLWNTYKFLVTYSDINKWTPGGKKPWEFDLNILDKWIIAELSAVIKTITQSLDKYDAMTAAKRLEQFVTDLSTWYIRRSRSRFAKNDSAAHETLYYVVTELIKLLAPFVPFITEEIYRNLVKNVDEEAIDSIHLTSYPQVAGELKKFVAEVSGNEIMNNMADARMIVKLCQAARVESRMKIRQPLNSLRISGVELPEEFSNVIAEELNVKNVEFTKEIKQQKGWMIKEQNELKIALDTELTEELKLEGLFRELVRTVQDLRKRSGLKMGENAVLYWSTESGELKDLFAKMGSELKDAVTVSELVNKEIEDSVEKKVNGMGVKLKVVKE